MKRLLALVFGVSIGCAAAAMPVAVPMNPVSPQPDLNPIERWDGEPMLFRALDGQPVMGRGDRTTCWAAAGDSPTRLVC